jgi:hypothetical protein
LPGQTGVDRVEDSVRFKAQEPEVSYSRSDDWFRTQPSRGFPNHSPLPSPLIEEFMYNPSPGAEESAVNLEYIEICNPTGEPVRLSEPAGSWRLDGAVSYIFALDTTIPPNGCLQVVGFDPADASAKAEFLNAHQVMDVEINLVGPFEGKLSNQGESIALEKPQPVAPGAPDVEWVILDEVIYFDQTPWSAEADGTGQSLHRVMKEPMNGNNPANWTAKPPAIGIIGFETPVETWMLFE